MTGPTADQIPLGRPGRHRRYRTENQERVNARRLARDLKFPEKAILRNAKYRAKMNGVAFDLTLEDIVVPTVCPVLGIPLRRANQNSCGPTDSSPSLDRIENSKGYVRGNVIIISHKANSLKRNATPEELRAVADFFHLLRTAERGP